MAASLPYVHDALSKVCVMLAGKFAAAWQLQQAMYTHMPCIDCTMDAVQAVIYIPGHEHLALPCPVQPCPALPCPALPCPALPCPALPCPALLWPTDFG